MNNSLAVVVMPHELCVLQIENKREDHGWETVQVHVREKRKWRKYPCAVRGNSFVQFKDNKVCAWMVVPLMSPSM